MLPSESEPDTTYFPAFAITIFPSFQYAPSPDISAESPPSVMRVASASSQPEFISLFVKPDKVSYPSLSSSTIFWMPSFSPNIKSVVTTRAITVTITHILSKYLLVDIYYPM